MAFVTQMLTFH